MTSPTRHPGRPPNGASLLLLFVVLGGVFGMHGLDAHGVADSHVVGVTTHSSMSAPAMVDGAAEVPSAHLEHSTGERSVLAASFTGPRPAGNLPSAMALCLGVLAASVLLLLVRRARGLPVIGLAPRWITAVHRSEALSRDRDPPSLTLLSVRRC